MKNGDFRVTLLCIGHLEPLYTYASTCQHRLTIDVSKWSGYICCMITPSNALCTAVAVDPLSKIRQKTLPLPQSVYDVDGEVMTFLK